jgi:hypothetical protein
MDNFYEYHPIILLAVVFVSLVIFKLKGIKSKTPVENFKTIKTSPIDIPLFEDEIQVRANWRKAFKNLLKSEFFFKLSVVYTWNLYNCTITYR